MVSRRKFTSWAICVLCGRDELPEGTRPNRPRRWPRNQMICASRRLNGRIRRSALRIRPVRPGSRALHPVRWFCRARCRGECWHCLRWETSRSYECVLDSIHRIGRRANIKWPIPYCKFIPSPLQYSTWLVRSRPGGVWSCVLGSNDGVRFYNLVSFKPHGELSCPGQADSHRLSEAWPWASPPLTLSC